MSESAVPEEVRKKLEENRIFAGASSDKIGKSMTTLESERQILQAHYGAAYLENVQDVESKLGVKKGKEMTFLEANEGRGNPNFGKGGGYTINCQSCVVANELRRRGFDVSAQENTGRGSTPYELSIKTEKAWLDKDGNMPNRQKAGGYFYDATLSKNRMKTLQEMTRDLNELTKAEGRYHIDYFWNRENGGRGHIITLERRPDNKIQIYDPQEGVIYDWGHLSKNIKRGMGIYVLRVDDLFVNSSIIDGIVKKN